MTQDRNRQDIRQAPELSTLWAKCMEQWLNAPKAPAPVAGSPTGEPPLGSSRRAR